MSVNRPDVRQPLGFGRMRPARSFDGGHDDWRYWARHWLHRLWVLLLLASLWGCQKTEVAPAPMVVSPNPAPAATPKPLGPPSGSTAGEGAESTGGSAGSAVTSGGPSTGARSSKSAGKTGKKAKSAGSTTDSPFPYESPSDVFAVAATAEPMQLVPTANSPADLWQVTSGQIGIDSTQFVAVGAGSRPGPGTASPPGANVTVSPGPTTGTTGTNRPTAARALPEGFAAVGERGVSADGWPLRIRCRLSGQEMAFVPAGSGRLGFDQAPENARPEVVVLLPAFYIDLTEVTVGQFTVFREQLREQKKRLPQPLLNDGQDSALPALGVTWGDALAFARWCGKELPTEAEFEKAGRGEPGYRYPWGNSRPVWSKPRTADTISRVGVFSSDVSPFGVYDLSGNAKEWVADWYSSEGHADASSAPQPLREWKGVSRPSSQSQRVVKGAQMIGSRADWSVALRSGLEMSARQPQVGFRCVLRIKAE
jgi:formylglycine-generating enzyme required for sulfatase activity